MVESNNDEERLARIEYLLERLQRDAAIHKALTAQLVLAVDVLTPRPRPLAAARPNAAVFLSE